jgi:hypothetical protein
MKRFELSAADLKKPGIFMNMQQLAEAVKLHENEKAKRSAKKGKNQAKA